MESKLKFDVVRSLETADLLVVYRMRGDDSSKKDEIEGRILQPFIPAISGFSDSEAPLYRIEARTHSNFHVDISFGLNLV